MNLLKHITGGRPMTRKEVKFVDHVSGETVALYEDTLGRMWLAGSRWAMFRVEHHVDKWDQVTDNSHNME